MAPLVDYEKAAGLLKKYGISSVRSSYVGSAEEASSFLKGDDPIVLKAISQKALHKSKSGLVKLNLRSEEEIRKAYADLVKRAKPLRPYKILAQSMLSGGLEMIIGGSVDPQFGKMVLLGLGGIYVETFKDFALRLCPISTYDAASMLRQLRSRKIIAPDNRSENMIAGLLLRASRMFTESNLSEMDLNPIILHDGRYDAVDIRLLE
jgi:succinyl-CoA synthetase beta subunit